MAQQIREEFVNDVATTLNGAITNVATSLVVASATGFPAAVAGISQFRILVESEIMIVTATSGTTFTVTRDAEGTTAAAHATGVAVDHVLTAVALREWTPSWTPLPRMNRMLAWTADTTTIMSSSLTTGGTLYLNKIYIPQTIVVTNILCSVQTAASANLAASYAGIYDSAGILLGQTADIQTNLETTGTKTLPLSAPLTITGGPDVWVYVALLCPTGATTYPALARAAGSTVINFGLTAADGFRYGTSGASLATLPASFTISGMTSITAAYWFGLS